MERILRYSLERRKPIRLIFQREGALQQRNVQVLALESGRVRLLSRRPQEEWEMPLADVLGVALAAQDRRMIPAAALIALSSLSAYWELVIPLGGASLMMLAAAAIVLAGAKEGEDAHEP